MEKIFKEDSIIVANPTLTVVVDKEAEVNEGDTVFNKTAKTLDKVVSTAEILDPKYADKNEDICGIDAARDYKHPKVIAQLSPSNLTGIPVIKLLDEVEELAKDLFSKKEKEHSLPDGYYSWTANRNPVEKWIDGYKIAQSKGSFTEEDMIGLLNHLHANYSVTGGTDTFRLDDSLIDKSSEEIVKEFIPSVKKQNHISELVLETEELGLKDLGQISRLKIHKPESNTIIPVSVKYK